MKRAARIACMFAIATAAAPLHAQVPAAPPALALGDTALAMRAILSAMAELRVADIEGYFYDGLHMPRPWLGCFAVDTAMVGGYAFRSRLAATDLPLEGTVRCAEGDHWRAASLTGISRSRDDQYTVRFRYPRNFEGPQVWIVTCLVKRADEWSVRCGM